MSGLRYEKIDHVGVVTIDRPEALNSIDGDLEREMTRLWLELRDDDDVWVAVLAGSGQKAFCTGGDMKTYIPGRMSGQVKPTQYPRAQNFAGLTRLDFYKPLIASVNGYAIAGGLELVLCCDLRIAADTAQFGFAEVRWGILPGAGGTQRISRNVPYAIAMEMLLTGKRIDAQAALRWGLVNKVVPAEALREETLRWAQDLCTCGPLALRATKEAVLRGLALESGLAFESFLFDGLMHTEDSREGTRAFGEQRKPVFRGK